MRTITRLLIFAAIVLVISLTIAPPVAGQALARVPWPGATAMVRQLPTPPAVDVTGTYLGTLTPDGEGGPDNGMIVIRREKDALVVTAGPNAEQQFVAEKVTQTGSAVTFDIAPPGDVPRIISFALKVEGWKLSGVATMNRDGQQSTARVDFTKQ